MTIVLSVFILIKQYIICKYYIVYFTRKIPWRRWKSRWI